jgi:hypothetical protein
MAEQGLAAKLFLTKPGISRCSMDIVFIGAIAVFFALMWGMTVGCAQLGERK